MIIKNMEIMCDKDLNISLIIPSHSVFLHVICLYRL